MNGVRIYKIFPFFSCLFFFAAGCYSPHGANVADVNERLWTPFDEISVAYDNSDTVSSRNIGVILRYGRAPGYDKIFVSVTFVSPAGYSWCDTMAISCYPQGGKTGRYYETEQSYRENAVLGEEGRYLVEFRPVAPEEVEGISAIGVNIH